MEVRNQPGFVAPWWARKVAQTIHDPVVRLRFLQAVVRPSDFGTARRRCFPRWLRVLAAAILAAILAIAFLARTLAGPVARPARPALPPAAAPPAAAPGAATDPMPEVWQVESAEGQEAYSNGLRIDGRFAVPNLPRSYVPFSAASGEPAGPRTTPSGIVFHSTESAQAPFREGENGKLRTIAASLLDYVRGKHAYHFLIDRFGRVFRVVRESDAAFHAGYSVWCDERWLYVNLNDSFLGVALEAETRPGQSEAELNPAQLRAAGALTEMLRARYAIPASDCVTHAQVSVNPSNMRAGYHTDWASSFPFRQVGLPDNYALPLPAVWRFGFRCDLAFDRGAGPRMSAAAERAGQMLESDAARRGMPAGRYRERLEAGYRAMLAAARRRPGMTISAEAGEAEGAVTR